MTAAVLSLAAFGLVAVSTALGRRAEQVTLPDPPPRVADHVGATVDWSPAVQLASVSLDTELADWEILARFDAIIADLTRTPDWLAEFQRDSDLLAAEVGAREAPDPLRAAWAAAGLGPDTGEYPLVPAPRRPAHRRRSR